MSVDRALGLIDDLLSAIKEADQSSQSQPQPKKQQAEHKPQPQPQHQHQQPQQKQQKQQKPQQQQKQKEKKEQPQKEKSQKKEQKKDKKQQKNKKAEEEKQEESQPQQEESQPQQEELQPQQEESQPSQPTCPPCTQCIKMLSQNYLNSSHDIQTGEKVQITNDIKLLTEQWKESELGLNDELEAYLGVIGKVMEIEEDDGTLELRWENLDTAWIPAKACAKVGNEIKETAPGMSISWLSPESVENKGVEKPTPQSENKPAKTIPFPENIEYFKSTSDVEQGRIVRITPDLKLLESAWKECALGLNDELDAYLGIIGKVMEIEEDDDTLEVRWENLDTAWIPAKACFLVDSNTPLSSPGMNVSWLSPESVENKDSDYNKKSDNTNTNTNTNTNKKEIIDESTVKFFGTVEEVQVGQHVQITTDINKLKQAWKDCELGLNDELEAYLGVIGKITQIEEDDDTLELRWENLDTAWIPVKACFDANGKKETCPSINVSWLSPSEVENAGLKDPEASANTENVE